MFDKLYYIEYSAEERAAYASGVAALLAGKLQVDNPYRRTTRRYRAWDAGWKHEFYSRLTTEVRRLVVPQ